MSGCIAPMNNITRIRSNNVGDADVLAVCQIIKHYRELMGEDLSVSFIGPMSNSYHPRSIRSITSVSGGFEISCSTDGLFGTKGTLPRMLSMAVSASVNSSDRAGMEFLQIFENRYYTLNLAASSKYNLLRQKEEESFAKRKSTFKISDLLTTLMGISLKSEFRHLDKRSLIKYSPVLNSASTNIDCLINILTDYFQLEFTAKYSPVQMRLMSSSVYTKISRHEGTNVLGINTQLGRRIPIYGQQVDVFINVKTYDEYKYVFARHNLLNAVQELISYYLKNRFAYRLFVVADVNYLPRTVLSSRNTTFVLGRNICIRSKKSTGFIKIPIAAMK